MLTVIVTFVPVAVASASHGRKGMAAAAARLQAPSRCNSIGRTLTGFSLKRANPRRLQAAAVAMVSG